MIKYKVGDIFEDKAIYPGNTFEIVQIQTHGILKASIIDLYYVLQYFPTRKDVRIVKENVFCDELSKGFYTWLKFSDEITQKHDTLNDTHDNHEVVKNMVLFKEFKYCRTCKVEVN